MKTEFIGLQMYSLHKLCGENYTAAVQAAAKAGYDGIQFAGYFGIPAKEMKQLLDDNGLTNCGSHCGMGELDAEHIQATIDYNLEVGSKWIVCPAVGGDWCDSRDAWLRTSDTFNRVGEKCRENGLLFGYHNHAFEFQRFDGEFGLKIMLDNTDPKLVFMEFDTAWVEYPGEKALDWMKQYADRSAELIHIKDLKAWGNPESTEVGNGVLDFYPICAYGKQLGLPWYIVEQEEFERDPVEAVAICRANLAKILAEC